MKNQNDLIISIVALLVMAIVIGVSWGTARTPGRPQPPQPAVVSPAVLPSAAVVWANSLPTSSGAAGGGAPAAGGAAGPSSRKQN